MGGEFDFATAVRPLFEEIDDKFTFAGTGFFVDHPSRELLVTARHVAENRKIVVGRQPDREGLMCDFLEPADLIASSGAHLAVLEMQNYKSPHKLKLISEMPTAFDKVASVEYSRFEIKDKRIYENASCRIGNIVRTIVNESYWP